MAGPRTWLAKLRGFSKNPGPGANWCLDLLADRPEAEALWLGTLATHPTRLGVFTTLLLGVLWELGRGWPGDHPGDPLPPRGQGIRTSNSFPKSCRVLVSRW